jgi:hypothetical protein
MAGKAAVVLRNCLGSVEVGRCTGVGKDPIRVSCCACLALEETLLDQDEANRGDTGSSRSVLCGVEVAVNQHARALSTL